MFSELNSAIQAGTVPRKSSYNILAGISKFWCPFLSNRDLITSECYVVGPNLPKFKVATVICVSVVNYVPTTGGGKLTYWGKLELWRRATAFLNIIIERTINVRLSKSIHAAPRSFTRAVMMMMLTIKVAHMLSVLDDDDYGDRFSC